MPLAEVVIMRHLELVVGNRLRLRLSDWGLVGSGSEIDVRG
jgi:hypothetical protein